MTNPERFEPTSPAQCPLGMAPEDCCESPIGCDVIREENESLRAARPESEVCREVHEADLRRIQELEVENKRLREVVEHYAADSNWINGQEYKTFPGFHGAAVARAALDTLDAVAFTPGQPDKP